MNRTKENASRLASALYRHSDKSVIKVLAHYLAYEEEQLIKDIDDLHKLIYQIKNESVIESE